MEYPTFQQLKKNLKKEFTGTPKHLKLAILGDSATQFVNTAIRGYGILKGFNIDIYEAEYNQIEPEIINPNSELYTFNPDFILILHSSEQIHSNFLKRKGETRSDFASNFLNTIEQYFDLLKERLACKILIANHPIQPDEVFGNFSLKITSSFRFQLAKLNFKLLELCQDRGNVFLIDLEAIQSYIGYHNRIDHRFHSQTSMVFSIDFLPIFAKHVIEIIGGVSGTNLKKCLILDLDNTTWGGIIGDDGLENILIGNIKGGKPFNQIQSWAKELKNRGIILCICSKNTESVAKEPFEKHPDMILRLDDISVFVANWENKADNIRYIQSVLNIGFDSIVFIDDNPFERNLVKGELPKVIVPDLPEDPSFYLSYLRGLNLFETAIVSKEDTNRTKKYQEEAKRIAEKVNYKSIDQYLENLEMEAIISPFNTFSISRVAQLTQRSNQFNLRTIRYTTEEIKNLISSSIHLTFQLRLQDKFGDYGIVSLVIGEIQENNVLFLDSWIMSCRVLKRGVEKFVLDQIVERAITFGIKSIVGEYIPTAKNKLVENHYQHLGFIEKENLWELDVATYQPTSKYISVTEIQKQS